MRHGAPPLRVIKAIPPPDPAARTSPGSRRPLSCASLIAPMMQQQGGQQQGGQQQSRQGSPPQAAHQEVPSAADRPAGYATRSKRSLEAAEGIEQGPGLQGKPMHTVIPCWPGWQSALRSDQDGLHVRHSHRRSSWTLWCGQLLLATQYVSRPGLLLTEAPSKIMQASAWDGTSWVPFLSLQVPQLNRRAAAAACPTYQRTDLGGPQSSCPGTTARPPSRGMAASKVAMAGRMQAASASATGGHRRVTAQMPAPATHQEPLPLTLGRQSLRIP